MRHSVSILIGNELKNTAKELKKYILKYGESSLIPYFNCYSWIQNNGNVDIIKIEKASEQPKFTSGLNDIYNIEFETNSFQVTNKTNTIALFFDRLHSSIMTAGNNSNSTQLHICIYVPLYDESYWQEAKFIIELLKSLPNKFFHIDVVGLNYDLQYAITSTANVEDAELRTQRVEISKKTISEIIKYRKDTTDHIFHFLLMQNTQEGGISLDLQAESFVRILGEFSLLCVEHYINVFGVANPESDLQAFGLSVLHFDRFYFIEYLLHKAYIYVMDREGVNTDAVDINAVFNKSETILKDRIHLLSKFLNNEVLPRLDKNEEEKDIIADVCPQFEILLQKLQNDCDEIINDNELSIPFKRAVLSALLGYDDILFENNIFNDETPILDDLDSESMDIYINANNSLLPKTVKDTEDYTDEERQLFSEAILSEDLKKVKNPLKEMKSLHTEMQRRMGHIRNLEKETNELEKQIINIGESKKSLIEDNFFVYGEYRFRLLPNIDEIPFEEDYIAHTPIKKSVDLRENFTEIKNQGKQGSCTAFAVTSIFEYILKQNKNENSNLSEAFVYYKARQKVGQTNKDEGSRYYYAIQSMMEDGICTEELMPYSESDFTTQPTKAAKEDASTRKVKKALNLKLGLNNFKSALEDGYPIAVNVMLYESFGEGLKGIISMPTQEELNNFDNKENKHRRHAMIICGFNDEKELFLVRNSWGKEFGDNGYCYMPYSYFKDEKLVSFAFVITEVEVENPIIVKNTKPISHLKFDESDAEIRYAIKRNFLNEENLKLKYNEINYKILRTQYEFLKGSLKDPNNQVRLRNARITKLSNNIEELNTAYEIAKNNKSKQLNNFDIKTKQTAIKTSLISLGVLFVIGLLAYFVGFKVFAWKYTWYALIGVTTAVLIMIFLYFPIRKHKRRLLKKKLNDVLEKYSISIDKEKKDLRNTRVKMHIAGHFLTKLFDTQSVIVDKHDSTSSFLENLKTWYNEELKIVNNFNAETQLPFIPILDNQVLDNYFESHKEAITQGISLCQNIVDFALTIQNKTINKDDLIIYKNNIKQQFVDHLKNILQNFYIYNALHNTINYTFLEINENILMSVLPKLDRKSKIFVCDNGTIPINPSKLILINTPTDQYTQNWRNFYPKFFSVQPNFFRIQSPDKAIVFQIAELNENQIAQN